MRTIVFFFLCITRSGFILNGNRTSSILSIRQEPNIGDIHAASQVTSGDRIYQSNTDPVYLQMHYLRQLLFIVHVQPFLLKLHTLLSALTPELITPCLAHSVSIPQVPASRGTVNNCFCIPGIATWDNKVKRIITRYIRQVVRNEEELNTVVPPSQFVEYVLIPKKSDQMQ